MQIRREIMTLPIHNFIDVHEYTGSDIVPVSVPVSAEYAFTFMLNGNPYMTFASSGSGLESYALGHLISEGIVTGKQDIKSITVNEEERIINIVPHNDRNISRKLSELVNVTAAGGKSRRELPPRDRERRELPVVDARIICRCAGDFLAYSNEHDLTHGVHSAALFGLAGDRKAFFDDIGRHNAVDKIIGFAAAGEISWNENMLFTTGRISSEITFKIINSDASVLVSRASPTSFAVELARMYNLLVIARARGAGFWIINGRDRVTF